MPLLHLKNSLNRPQQQRWLPERSTNTFLVAWLAHSWLIPLPASPTQFADCITCLANTVCWLHYLPRQHNLLIALPASPTQFTDCITCLANTNLLIALPASPTQILFWFVQTITFSPVYLFYIFEFEYVWIYFIPMFHSFATFPSTCALIGSAERPWTATQKGRHYYLDVQRAA